MEREYSYRGIHKLGVLISQISGIICIVISTPIAGFLLFSITKVEVTANVPLYNDPRVTLICLAFWCLLLSWTVGVLFINYYPTIWLHGDGIEISFFFFFRNHIPWQDIIDVRSENFWGWVLVRARRITPFHRYYSWHHSHLLHPGFLIGKQIENREVLLEEIRKRMQDTIWLT